jgi:hypothetical protein
VVPGLRSAKTADDGGKFKEAYEFYLEYVRQAEGLNGLRGGVARQEVAAALPITS